MQQNIYIWKGPIPKKIRFFLWEVSLGSINTGDFLIKKAPWIASAPNWCVLCHHSGESIIHILVFCDFAVILGDYSILLQLSHDLPS